MNKSFIAALASGLLCSAFGAGALAGETEPQAPGVVVTYGDLDLQSAQGKQRLDSRLRQAARSVCPDDSSQDLGTRLAGRRCVQQAVSRGRAGVSEQQVARAAAGQENRG